MAPFEAFMDVREGVMGGAPLAVRINGEDIGVSKGFLASCGDGLLPDSTLHGDSF